MQEYEDDRLKKHAQELVDKLNQNLVPLEDEDGSEGGSKDDSEWEDEDDEVEEGDGDEEMTEP
jgi:hypothetical protein